MRSRGEGAGGPGYELVRRRGLAAWIQALSGWVGGPAPEPVRASHLLSTGTEGPAAGGAVPASLYPELTRLLAGLALGRLQEGRG
jgi:hypothetical protein